MSPVVLNTLATICFVAGKSGGHLLPCITMSQQMHQKHPKAEMYIFSTGSQLDHKIIDQHKHLKHYVPTNIENIPYQEPWLIPFFACKLGWYFCKSLYKLWSIKPDKVMSFGGLISVPVCLAAKCLQIPFEIYELNVEPGRATNFLAYFTDTIHICFAKTKEYFSSKKCILFDYSIRFTQQDKRYNKTELLRKYNFSPQRKTILILGGSQGSTLLNNIAIDCLTSNPDLAKQIQVVHQAGDGNTHDFEQRYTSNSIPNSVFGYHEKLQDFYNLADVIISRAGAGTLFEIKFFEKTCITIPHQTANTNHQIMNALAMQQERPQQFYIIKQPELTVDRLYQQLTQLL